MKYFLLSLMLLLTSCTGSSTLGLRSHSFGSKAKHIVWLQVPGLSQEHLAFLKIDRALNTEPMAFERMSCIGSLWSYSLLELRPNYYNGFLSQVLGSKSVEGSCEDLDRPAVWNYFENVGYNNAVYEVVSKNQKKFYELGQCESKQKPLSESVVWVQGKPGPKDLTFHFQEDANQEEPGIYFDRSCNDKGCFSSLFDNIKSLWSNWIDKKPKTFLTIRETEFYENLTSRRFEKAKDRLLEIEKLLNYFLEESKTKSIFILVTSSEAHDIEFPKSGPKWGNLKRNILYRHSKLNSPLWAYGPSAENFCGSFEESEVSKRIIWTPEKNLLKLTF